VTVEDPFATEPSQARILPRRPYPTAHTSRSRKRRR
jgi:hypothetical protein